LVITGVLHFTKKEFWGIVRETDREMKKKSEKGITPEQNTQLKVDGRALRQYAIHGFPMLIE